MVMQPVEIARTEADRLGGPISRRSLPERIAERIGRLIVQGTFAQRSVLPGEIELTRRFGVSRSVMREALKLLSAKGLVTPRRKTGTVVQAADHWEALNVDVLAWRLASDPTEEMLRSLFELRRGFEPLAASLAAARGSDAQIAEVKSAYAAMEAAKADLERSIQTDIAFHHAIVVASCNQFLIPLTRAIQEALRVSFALSDKKQGARERSLPRHKAVATAIMERNEKLADQAMRKLLDESLEDVLWVIRTHRSDCV